MQEEKQARAHLFTLLVMTGCPTLLLLKHIIDASGPASQGWLPFGQQVEQQIKLWRKEVGDMIHTQSSSGGGGGSSHINI